MTLLTIIAFYAAKTMAQVVSVAKLSLTSLIGQMKYMRQFLEYINERDDLSVSLLSSGDGLAVIRLSE